MIYGDAMTAYSIVFDDGTKLSLIAYSDDQARLLAQRTLPEKTIASVVPFEIDAFPY